MVRIEDCKKGLFLTDGKNWKHRILKVGKTSVTIDQKINWGYGCSRKPHQRVMRISEINYKGLELTNA